jgi:proliferating cell nuclear antigen PCNA
MTIIFKAKTTEAYHLKILAELLSNNIKTGCFEIDENGIRLSMMDSHRKILIILNLLSENFTVYKYKINEKVKYLGINLNHFHKLLKSIKKKDSLQIFIDSKDPTDLHIKVIPKENNRVTTSYVKIQSIQNVNCEIPVINSKPVIISSSEFQKMIKDMNSITNNNNNINVSAKNFHIEFMVDAGGILKRKVEFGELELSDSEESSNNSDDEYNQTFSTEQLSRITKLAGLSSQLKIFPGKPLLFRSNIGALGEISIYIKSKEELEIESRGIIDDSDNE